MGNLTFLQLALGYIVGKIFVAVVLIPRFFSGQPPHGVSAPHRALWSAHRTPDRADLSGDHARCLTAFASLPPGSFWRPSSRRWPTAGALARGLMPVNGPHYISPGRLRLPDRRYDAGLYTLLGGMRAVIWTDVVQLFVYMTGTLIAALMVLNEIPGGWMEVVDAAGPAGKFVAIDLTFDLTRSYTFWSGVLGGMFLAAGTHGTDQMFVQRYLCARSPRDASRALIWSGVIVLVQFAVFLGIGVLLWVYYTVYSPDGLVAITLDGIVQTDRILPTFMMSHLPVGVRGLVLAAIVAAAMSTLSSSLNSSAASTVGDFLCAVDRQCAVCWALPHRLPMGHGRLGARSDRRGRCGDQPVQPSRRRGTGHSIVHARTVARSISPGHDRDPPRVCSSDRHPEWGDGFWSGCDF